MIIIIMIIIIDIHVRQFLTRFLVRFGFEKKKKGVGEKRKKWGGGGGGGLMLEIRENAVLCPAVCISDVKNKAGMY